MVICRERSKSDRSSYRAVLARRLATIMTIFTLSTATRNSWSNVQWNHSLKLLSHDVFRLPTPIFSSICLCIITCKSSHRWPSITWPKYSSLHVFMIAVNSLSVDILRTTSSFSTLRASYP